MEGRTMLSYLAAIVGFLLLLLSAKGTDGSSRLLCYQCAHTTTENNTCMGEMRRELNDTMDIPNYPYIKDCTTTNPSWDKCMTVSVHYNNEGKNKLSLYLRGCTDGYNLTFDNPRFQGLNPTNRSTCAFTGTVGATDHKMVCYTFCDTDMCNGPQAPPTAPDPCANYTSRTMTSGDYYDDDDYYDIPPGCGAAGIYSGHAAVVMAMTTVMVLVLFKLQF